MRDRVLGEGAPGLAPVLALRVPADVSEPVSPAGLRSVAEVVK